MAVATLRADVAPPDFKRTVLLKQDMTSFAGHEAIMVRVEIPPGAAEGPHIHHAEVYAFVLQGNPTLELEGSPTVTQNPGDVIHIPPGKVHQAINKGNVPVQLAAVFIAEKGQPLTTPVK